MAPRHRIAVMTSFLHVGQLSGSFGSSLGCGASTMCADLPVPCFRFWVETASSLWAASSSRKTVPGTCCRELWSGRHDIMVVSRRGVASAHTPRSMVRDCHSPSNTSRPILSSSFCSTDACCKKVAKNFREVSWQKKKTRKKNRTMKTDIRRPVCSKMPDYYIATYMLALLL